MSRIFRFVRRNSYALIATALLMAGAGCVGAARQAGQQLTTDAMKPITAPLNAYQQGTEAASSTEANQQAQIDAAGGLQ